MLQGAQRLGGAGGCAAARLLRLGGAAGAAALRPQRRHSHAGATCGPPTGADRICRGIGRLSNIVIEGGQGSYVFTTAGEKYLDFATGIGVSNLGHGHPAVTRAMHEQIDKGCWHAQVNISFHKPMLELVEKLATVMPDKSLDTFFLWNSGAEAVEAAVKLARHATGKPNIIAMQGAYHGRTLLTMSMTTSKTIFRKGYGPHASGIHIAPYPYCHRCECASKDPCLRPLQLLEVMLETHTAPEETAAIVIEPVLGEGGYVPAPTHYLQGLRELCDKHGMLLVFDEVQSGFGRTGKYFAAEHSGVRPDILVFAKGVASGMPLSGIASRRELMDRQHPGCQGGTYAGNAVACAASSATIDVLTEGSVLANAQERSKQLFDGLRKMQSDGVAPIADIRGLGLMIGVELDDTRVMKGTANAVSKGCLERGLLLLNTGNFESLRLMPPLTVTEEECQKALGIIAEALRWAISK
eukprot:TRINITY_DN9791_c0_g1_i1.p1 TRINITY_DN9791_c0_g1~~TRINITY_DN9791_c0_g1_i1.p1  ORF type:complete len:500 (+),score=138.26 TRINITY_DN9791_c0_g1_i1:99-1502(+)